MESPDNEGSIPLLDTKCTPNSNHIIHITVYRKPTHTDRYLDWNSNHPNICCKVIIQSTDPQSQNSLFHTRAISQGGGLLKQGLAQEQLP